MNPMISVVMPVYNAEKYVAEAIDSILNQTYGDFEFIIVDDCSTDNSYDIIRMYAETDNRIKLFRNDINSKLPKTLNFGISKSVGKYIARMDADDISLPERFAKQLEFMEQNPDVGVFGSYAVTIGACSRLIKVQLKSCLIKSFSLFFCNNMLHPSVIIRKNIFETYSDLKYDENLSGLAEDYDLWVRMLLKGIKFANLDLPLLKYRISPKQATKVLFEDIERFSQQVIIKNLKILYGNNFTAQLLNEHELYIQSSRSLLQQLFSYYGFCLYKEKFMLANSISKVLTKDEANNFFNKIDVVLKIRNKCLDFLGVNL